MSTDPSPYLPPAPPLAPERTGAGSVHLALTFLALTFAVYLLAQIRALGEQTRLLQWQINGAQTQTASLKTAARQLHDLSVKREPLVKQSSEIQSKYQSLLNDVLELARDDKDAREVVEAWRIQRSNSGSAESAAPVAAPVPAAAPAPANP